MDSVMKDVSKAMKRKPLGHEAKDGKLRHLYPSNELISDIKKQVIPPRKRDGK